MDDKVVLCVANGYDKKYYLDENFENMPQSIKDELKIICVLFTEEIGGIIQFIFDEEGNLEIEAEKNSDDFMYDEVGAGLLIGKIKREKKDLFEGLEMYFKVFYLGMDMDEELGIEKDA